MKDFLKKAFPYLTIAASAVPGGNVATTVLGKILNLKDGATLDDAGLAAMNATPEQRAALQAEENRHVEAMRQLNINSAEEFDRILAGDRDSARKREMTVKDRMPAALAIMAVLSLMFCICLMAFVKLPDGAKDALLLLIGFVGASYKDVYGYFFGSSSGSEAKNVLLAQK
jgi:hypothetical protein